MFHKLQNFIHTAVEALAPDMPPHEIFVFHWKSVTNYFIETTDDKMPVQSTNIPYHLTEMLEVLNQEEEATDGGPTGPCLEYLLQHKILETLYTLGRADCPPGMKQQVLSFFTNLLGRMQTPLLPHINVHKPVQRLIRVCGNVRAGPSENEEIHFLCTVCAKLRQDPYLVNFFLETPGTSSSGNSTPDAPTPSSSSGAVSVEPEKPHYNLVTSLLALSKSEDSRIAVKACEGLMLCASLPEDHAASVIILYTSFCEVMADRLRTLFEVLPKTMEPGDIQTVSAKWGLDLRSEEADILTFPGKRQLISFLSWLDYVDQLIKESHKLISKALAVAVRERFLLEVIEPSLLQPSELGIITTTGLLTKIISSISAMPLIQEITQFLLGDSTSPETPSHEGDHKLRQTLIQRCDHLSDELTIETLKLFEVLLLVPNEAILQNLILRNLQYRSYYLAPVSNGEAKEQAGDPPPSPSSVVEDLLYEADVAKEEIEKVVNCFLRLLPEDTKSSAQTGDTGYDTYLRDAHRQCGQRAAQCVDFNWPARPIPTSENKDDPRDQFYEGAFFNMLFKKLQRTLDQPYDVNLRVTSVISLLAQFPHPQLQELLIKPGLPLVTGCQSLHQILQQVVTDLKGRIQRIPNFQRSVIAVRRQLMGLSTITDFKSLPHSNLLEAVIVLEEFCKELASIAFVRATSVS